MITVDVSETIAARDLKVSRCRQLIEFELNEGMRVMKVNVISSPKVIYIWTLKIAFLGGHWTIFNKFYMLA